MAGNKCVPINCQSNIINNSIVYIQSCHFIISAPLSSTLIISHYLISTSTSENLSTFFYVSVPTLQH